MKEQAADFQRFGQRFGAQWTPTTLVMSPEGTEWHRIEGFLPADDFQAQLMLGLARGDFKREKWSDAEKKFREIVDRFPNTDAAAEALYWAGVSRYKATGQGAALGETARAFSQRYRESPWAKKAQVWAK